MPVSLGREAERAADLSGDSGADKCRLQCCISILSVALNCCLRGATMEQYYNLRLGSGWDCCPTRQPQTLLAPSPPPGQLQGTLSEGPIHCPPLTLLGVCPSTGSPSCLYTETIKYPEIMLLPILCK